MLIAFIFHGCYSKQTVIKKVNDYETKKVNDYEIGKRYYHNSNYNKAIDNYSKAIDHYPVHSNAYNNRGAAYYYIGLYDTAIEDFNHAIKINPGDYKAYNNRGASYFQKRQYKKAIEDYMNAVRINPNYSIGYANLWIAYALKEEISNASQEPNIAQIHKSNTSFKLKNSNFINNSFEISEMKPEIKEERQELSLPKVKKISRENNTEYMFKPAYDKLKAKKAYNGTEIKKEQLPMLSKKEDKQSYFSIHVFSLKTHQKAIESSNIFKKKGHQNFIKKVNIRQSSGQLVQWYRVYIGKFSDMTDALNFGKKLKEEGFINYFAVHMLQQNNDDEND